MALTISNLERTIAGDHHCWQATITFDSSYPTGGESLTPGQVGLRTIKHIDAEQRGGYNFQFDRTNNKLLAFNGTTQIANTTDLSAVSTHIRFYGFE